MTGNTVKKVNHVGEAQAYHADKEKRFRQQRWWHALVHWSVIGDILRDAEKQQGRAVKCVDGASGQAANWQAKLEAILADNVVDEHEVEQLHALTHHVGRWSTLGHRVRAILGMEIKEEGPEHV